MRCTLLSCRIQREAESGLLVTVTRVEVVWVSIHLVLEDAIRGSARCIADDEHAPTGNIDPDGIGRVGGGSAAVSRTGWRFRRLARRLGCRLTVATSSYLRAPFHQLTIFNGGGYRSC